MRKVNPKATVLAASCKTGVGINRWIAWLRDALAPRGGLDWART